MEYEDVIAKLKSMGRKKNVAGMARFGISSEGTLGISVAALRPLAKKIGQDHTLALMLWRSGIHEARILAALIDDPKEVSEAQMEAWVAGFDSWDVCDQVCSHLFDKTVFAYDKAIEWAEDPHEFIRRAGFVLMCALAVHDKKANDSRFELFYPIIKRHAPDGRNYVKKAVSWAIRQIGKRSKKLNRSAVALAKEIKKMDSTAARWVANDALRELTSEKTRSRLKR